MNKTIEIKATGEKINFIKTSHDTNGQFVETLVTLPASGEGPRAHRHVLQTECFEAIEGQLGLDCGKKKIVLQPGQSFTVPANKFHRCYSVDGKDIKFKATFNPALSIEYLLTEMFESSNRANSKEPSTFDACYIILQTKGEYFLSDFSELFQKTVFPVIVMIGKVLGKVKAKPNRIL